MLRLSINILLILPLLHFARFRLTLGVSFKMAPVNGDVKWRCVIVCAILSVLLFERTVCVYTRMIVRTCNTSCRQ